jgi:putative SOS response-associated peptidase YedK
MCGRYTLSSPSDLITELFDLAEQPELDARYNIAPTQEAPVVRAADGGRRLDLLRWGLVPFWADDPKIGNRMINARSESVASKPAYREAFRRRRCLVATDGFFEWKKEPTGKQPWWIHREDGKPFAFAGLWERWRPRDGGDGEPLETFTILTTDAAPEIAHLHDRMPVIVGRGDFDRWLDPGAADETVLQALLAPDGAGLTAYPVSRRVNSPGNDTAVNVQRLEGDAG